MGSRYRPINGSTLTLVFEGSGERQHAARVAIGLLVPGLALVLTGHPTWIMYAVFGSFAGMYGRGEPRPERFRHQFHGAGMLATGVGIGTLLAHAQASAAVLVACVTAFATLGSVVTDRLQLRPGGPFFGIFALGATASVGPDLISWGAAVGICAGTAGYGVVLGLASPTVATSAQVRRPASALLAPSAVVHAVRYAVATGLAGAVGLLAGLDHANWAMASAAVPLAVVRSGEELALRAVVDRGVHRLVGTLAGLVVTAAVLLPHPSPTVLALAVIVLIFPTELFMSRHYGIALGFFTPLIMIMTDLAHPAAPARMLLDRGVDTAIGVAAAIAAAALIGVPLRRRTGA